MRKIVYSLLGVLAVSFVITYLVLSARQSNLAAEKFQSQRDQKQSDVAAAIELVAVKDHADIGWPEKLSRGNKVVIAPLLTAELQNVWVTERPILFIGKLADIVKNPDGSYQLTIEYAANQHRSIFVGSELQLDLKCNGVVVDSLVELKAANRKALWTEVAITANILTVKSTSVLAGDGNAKMGLTGYGTCISVMALPDILRY